ncbi:MAG TPA: galactose oxidase early set domain-containing protein [Actinomycetes bacterium]|nr:galactose oxidase early set domain-containing protein [Actinomycetes bacterium]
MRLRILLVGVLFAGGALVAVAEPAAGRPAETPAERIARETVAAVRASERARLTTSLAPRNRRLVAAGPLAGRWTTCQLPEGFNPVHASVLPDGTVLLMAGSGNDPAELAAGHFQSYIFSPDTCSTLRLPTPGDMFCSVHAMLPNGNILVAGGTKQYDPFYGLRTSYEYDWAAKQFVRRPLMAGGGRWYPGATQLGSGDVFVLSGLNGAGALNTQPEVYHPATRSWSVTPYRLSVPTYPHMLPTAGGRLFFTGVAFGGSAVRVGFLRPLTGSFQPVSGLDTNRRDEGASFFVPFSQGRKVMVAGGGVATTALVDLYSSANPVYRTGPSLDGPRKYLSHATLFDGRVLLAGGQDPQDNPVFTAQLYRPISNRLEMVASTSAAHQYHSNMWLDRTGRAILVGGNPARGSVQRLVERFEPWYVDAADRPQVTSAPSTIAHNQPFTAQVQLAAGTTLKHLRVFRLTSTTHQFGAAEGDFTLTPTGLRWSLTSNPNLTPPGYYYLVAVDSRDVPSEAKIVKII